MLYKIYYKGLIKFVNKKKPLEVSSYKILPHTNLELAVEQLRFLIYEDYHKDSDIEDIKIKITLVEVKLQDEKIFN